MECLEVLEKLAHFIEDYQKELLSNIYKGGIR